MNVPSSLSAWCSALLLAISGASQATSVAAQCSFLPGKWLSSGGLTVRQNLDKAIVAKPAFAQWTRPAGGTSSREIGIGIRFDAPCGGLVEAGPFVEILQNTLTEKRQDVRRYGLALEWQSRDIGAVNHTWSPFFTFRLGGKRDRVMNTDAIQINVFFTPIARGVAGQLRGWYRPNVITRVPAFGGSLFDFTYAPTVGLENEIGISAPSGTDEAGRTRLSTDGVVEVYPLATLLDSRVYLRVRHQFRHEIARWNAEGTRSHRWFEAAGGFYLVGHAGEKQTAGVEFGYVNGKNPEEGFLEQEITTIRLVLRRTP